MKNKYENKIKYYLECYVPITVCNFKCSYCYITHQNAWGSELADLKDLPEKIKKYFNKERFGGECLVNLCATGETLLSPYSVGIVEAMLYNEHYVVVVTNGILTSRIEELCSFPKEYCERLFVKMSFHYLELKKRGKIAEFFENVNKLHKAGISFTVEITPDDCYIPYIDEIKKVCLDNLGVLCHITIARDEREKDYPLMTKLSRKEFVKTWESFGSELFMFKESIFEVKRKEYCYAGKWSYIIDLQNGNYFQCYLGKPIGNMYEDCTSSLKVDAVGCKCPEAHCHNGHSFMTLGVIPGYKTPTYYDVRDRIMPNGEHWVKPVMAQVMSSKLENRNKKDSLFTKLNKKTSFFKKVKIKLGLMFKKKR